MTSNNNLIRITAPKHVIGKLKFEGVRDSDPTGVSFTGLDVAHDSDDFAARKLQTSSTTEHSTSHTADTTTHTETTTTVTVTSETHPKGAHPKLRPDVVPPKKIIATGEAVVRRHWTVELVDPKNIEYIIKVDGVPVGVKDGALFAFYGDDTDDVSRWHLQPAGPLAGQDAVAGAIATKLSLADTFQIYNASGSGYWIIPGRDGGQVIVANQ